MNTDDKNITLYVTVVNVLKDDKTYCTTICAVCFNYYYIFAIIIKDIIIIKAGDCVIRFTLD